MGQQGQSHFRIKVILAIKGFKPFVNYILDDPFSGSMFNDNLTLDKQSIVLIIYGLAESGIFLMMN